MAKTTKAIPKSIAEDFEKRNLMDYVKYAYKFYGSYTIENRAIPDFRDGLLPVQRRLLWAAHKMNGDSTQYTKSAKLIGLTLGSYHPHGDSACYGALVKMVQSPTPTIQGAGNWGSYDDPKSFAAMRYTEWRLNKFSRANFFTDSQLRVVDMVRNFDDTTVEPIILPSNLPYLLLDGSEGMAVGVVTGIPTYTPESVAKLVAMAIKGKAITPKLCMDTLELRTRYGAQFQDTEKNNEALLQFYRTGSATLYFDSVMELEANEIVITGISPRANFGNSMLKTVEIDGVSTLDDQSSLEDGIRIVITLKKGMDTKAKKAVLAEVQKAWRGMPFNARLNVTERLQADESGFVEVEFHPWSMPKFIEQWVAWRLDLEKRQAKAEAVYLKGRIAELELTILAALNFDVIKAALEQDDSEAYLVKKLKISHEDATTIMGKVLRTLKRTNVKQCEQRIKEMQTRIKELKQIHDAPQDSVLGAMKETLKNLVDER